jgi:hypothetical protein
LRENINDLVTVTSLNSELKNNVSISSNVVSVRLLLLYCLILLDLIIDLYLNYSFK